MDLKSIGTEFVSGSYLNRVLDKSGLEYTALGGKNKEVRIGRSALKAMVNIAIAFAASAALMALGLPLPALLALSLGLVLGALTFSIAMEEDPVQAKVGQVFAAAQEVTKSLWNTVVS